jgi:hypothetical protein
LASGAHSNELAGVVDLRRVAGAAAQLRRAVAHDHGQVHAGGRVAYHQPGEALKFEIPSSAT